MKGIITMKTKKSLPLAALLICALILSTGCSFANGFQLGGGIPGSGNIKIENRNLRPFESITIEYPGAEVLIQPGAKESIEIQADDNLLAQLSTEVVSGRFIIKSLADDWESSVNPSAKVKITVTAKDIQEIVLSAPVADVVINDLQAATLRFVVSGGAQVRMNNIQVGLLDSELSGAGDIQVSGRVDEFKLLHSGLGSFNAGGLQCSKATVELSGMGDATVRVADELNATITGAGAINYYGQPRIVQNGEGSVKPAE
jgi:hypothetical protein